MPPTFGADMASCIRPRWDREMRRPDKSEKDAPTVITPKPPICRDFGVSGIWKAVFHSVSAFCNAGFDLMGTPDMPFVSLTAYRADPGYQPDDFRPDPLWAASAF